MAGNAIDFRGMELVRSWNDTTQGINQDVRIDLDEIRKILIIILDNSEGDVADLLAQFARNLGESSSALFDGMVELNKAVDSWAQKAETFSTEAQAAIKSAANSIT